MANVGLLPAFYPLEDDVVARGKNNEPALADLIMRIANTMNGSAFRGQNVFNWHDGTTTTDQQYLLRQIVNNRHRAATGLRAKLLYLAAASATEQSGQGVRLTVTDVGGANTYDYKLGTDPSGAGSAQTDPVDIAELEIGQDTTGATGFTPAAQPLALDIGSMTSNGPGLVAGCVTIPQTDIVDASSATPPYMPTDFLHTIGEIVAVSSGSNTSNLDRLRSLFLHNWNFKRPQLGWSVQTPGTNYVDFTTSKAEFRYIFDQSIGDGGTAPSTTGPGITLPGLRYAASGINTSIKCAVYVYAAMSGATNTGSIGIAGKATDPSVMNGINAATSGAVTISGTTFQWYPAAGGTPMLFALNNSGATAYNRAVLCAKSSGSTDSVRIGAFTIFPLHSVTIT